jgi:hypothetical protein
MATNAQLLKLVQDLTARVVKLEAQPVGTTDLAPLTAEVDALQATVTELLNKTCVNQPAIDALNVAAGILAVDHVSEP